MASDVLKLGVDVAGTAYESLRFDLDLEAFGDLIFFLAFLKEAKVVFCLRKTREGAVVLLSLVK